MAFLFRNSELLEVVQPLLCVPLFFDLYQMVVDHGEICVCVPVCVCAIAAVVREEEGGRESVV